ncbi:MAG TPA: aldehyde:ferredoxin oxidoreductase [Deltaproteobacteria bacterium]|nr:aldehyde:ferredoxin oxidoreductase [Deltaproteobacteria bacterium]
MISIRQLQYEPAEVKHGYTDTILRVDLSTKKINLTKLSPEFRDKYIGGRGYALKLIWDETTALTRYDSPENILVMASGPLGNEPGFPGTGKFVVGTISPLTGTFIDSNVGGHFGPLLKLAGFDAIAVTGISKQDVVIVIDGDEGTISLVPSPIYMKEIDEGALSFGEALLKDMNGGGFSSSIAAVTAGKGALNARFGIINSLYYDKKRNRIRAKQAGRGGTGTVMRYKGLRAIVVRSSLPKANGNNAADFKTVRRIGSEFRKMLRKHDPEQLNLSTCGTTSLSEYMDKFHIFPVHNYQYGQSPNSSKLFAEVFFKKYFSKKVPDGCYFGCCLACAKGAEDVLLQRGPYAGRRVSVDGPEYETVAALSSMGIFNPHYVMEYNWYCDEYGLDSISTGVTISFLMECVQRGYLDADDIGYDLRFGDIDAADRLLHEIASGEGFGKIAGQGVARSKLWVARNYSARHGIPEEQVLAELNKFAMETKGLEFSMYVTKESLAQQGGYAFALKGPQHDEAWLIFIDQIHKELPTFEDKARALRWFPLIRTWFNATGLCKLPWIDVRHPEAAHTKEPVKNLPTLEYYVQYYNATVGTNKTLQDILNDSERLYVLQKLINLRQGKGTRESDRIPLRAIGPVYSNEYESRAEYYDEWLKEYAGSESIPDDPREKHRLLLKKRLEAFERLCDVVYEEKGFSQDGIPLPETVEKFGLMDEQARQLLEAYNVISYDDSLEEELLKTAGGVSR